MSAVKKFILDGVARQEDSISSKLFTPCLQYAINNNINSENQGVKIDSEYLSHLFFSDYIGLIVNSTAKLQEMFKYILDIS